MIMILFYDIGEYNDDNVLSYKKDFYKFNYIMYCIEYEFIFLILFKNEMQYVPFNKLLCFLICLFNFWFHMHCF